MNKPNSNSKALVSSISIGSAELEVLMLPDGSFAVAVPQIAALFNLYIPQASRDLKALMGKDFSFTKTVSELNSKAVNTVTLPEFALLSYNLSVAGRDSTGKATEIARAYYEKAGDTERLSIIDGLRALEKSNHKALRTRSPKQRERDIQEKFSVLWQCEKEYPVEYHRMVGTLPMPPVLIGRADLVNDRIVAEVKECKQWKHALGQLLAYQEVLQRQEIWLILFSSKGQPCNEIETICSRFGIRMKFIRN